MWSKISIEADKTYYWSIGFKEVFLKKQGKEWLLSINELPEAASSTIYGAVKESESDAIWSTFIGEKSNNLVVSPAFPDRLVVVKPITPFKVLPGKNIQLFVQIPMWIQFYAGTKKKENLFFECPSQELSSTWFGEPDNGMLAYAKSTDLSDTIKQPDEMFHHIVCPVRLTNDSNTLLDVQRLLLHCEYLNIYSGSNMLIANEVNIKFKGENEISDVQYSNQAPSLIKNLVQVSPARNNKSSNVISKSFHFIKSLTNY